VLHIAYKNTRLIKRKKSEFDLLVEAIYKGLELDVIKKRNGRDKRIMGKVPADPRERG
jgi:hypothetical protein